MKKTRLSVFETNSSSSHSLTLGKGQLVAVPFTPEQLRSGVIELRVGSYHWEWHRYYSAYEKMRYLLTQLVRNSFEDSRRDLIAFTQEKREECGRIDMLCRVVEAMSGCRVELQPGEASIDHQSEGRGMSVFESDKTLHDFLFDETAYIQTGNDNGPSGWTIQTDRGAVRYYEDCLRDAPKSWKQVTFQPTDCDELVTSNGARIGSIRDVEIMNELKKSGILLMAAWHSEGSYWMYDPRDTNLRMAGGKAYAQKDGEGYLLSSGFSVTSTFLKAKGYAQRKETLTFALSPKLAARILELPASSELSKQLDVMNEDLVFRSKQLQTPDPYDPDETLERIMLYKTAIMERREFMKEHPEQGDGRLPAEFTLDLWNGLQSALRKKCKAQVKALSQQLKKTTKAK